MPVYVGLSVSLTGYPLTLCDSGGCIARLALAGSSSGAVDTLAAAARTDEVGYDAGSGATTAIGGWWMASTGAGCGFRRKSDCVAAGMITLGTGLVSPTPISVASDSLARTALSFASARLVALTERCEEGLPSGTFASVRKPAASIPVRLTSPLPCTSGLPGFLWSLRRRSCLSLGPLKSVQTASAAMKFWLLSDGTIYYI